MMKHRLAHAIVLLASLVLASACGEPTASTPPVVTAAAVSFREPAVRIVLGQTLQPSLEIRDNQGQPVTGRAVHWSTSDPSVATVSSTGLIAGMRAGNATVAATVDGVSAALPVTVYIDGLHVWPDTLVLLPGGTRQLSARAQPAGRRPEPLSGATWESSNPAVARVDATGVVTAVAAGRATIITTVGSERAEGQVYVIAYPAPLRFASISASNNGTICGLTAEGEAYCWGNGRYGELGADSPTDRCENLTGDFREVFRCSAVPLPVARGLRFAALSAGNTHVCGMTAAGAVYCWGDNADGSLGGGTTGGRSPTPVRVAGGVVFRSISVGLRTTCGVSATSEGYCWGRNVSGNLGDGTTANSSVPTPVAGGLAFARIELNYTHACGLTTGGAAYCWGRNASGELGVEGKPVSCSTNLDCSARPVAVSGGHRFRQIDVGTGFSCGLAFDDRAYCWGDGFHGKLGNGQEQHSRVPVAVLGSSGFVTLSSGDARTCALDGDGNTFCWGRNVMRLDNSRPMSTPQPARSAPGASLRTIDVGTHTCGIGFDGIAICTSFTSVEPVPGQ